MSGERLRVALIHDVFHDPAGPRRLGERLAAARAADAHVALLPELPLDPWVPAERRPRAADAEPPGGPRERLLSAAAREAVIGVVGGAIVQDPVSGRRTNRALALDAAGRLVATYDKLHLPAEDGYWESDHYAPGAEPPRRIDAFGFPIGIQICSDLHRPAGCQLLGALGAGAILAPRATPPESYERWKLVIRADALTSGAYVLSANRPRPEGAVSIGGPSLAVGPDGAVLVETVEPMTVVELDAAALGRARREYPGYLAVRAAIYARGWSDAPAH
jgi:predicted amidohydrolase